MSAWWYWNGLFCEVCSNMALGTPENHIADWIERQIARSRRIWN